MSPADATEQPMTPGAVRRFFADRWGGTVPLATLFWRDMILVGTAINIACALIALSMLAAKLPVGLSIAAYAAPLPYNLFLVFALWRTADRQAGPAKAGYQFGATIWLIFALII